MMDLNTQQKWRLDIARILIRTSSLELVHRLIKVCVNGLLFSIRMVKEPFMLVHEQSYSIRIFDESISETSEEYHELHMSLAGSFVPVEHLNFKQTMS